jgi:thiosulfate/3-mercaptopyruvate sulfurtransferase
VASSASPTKQRQPVEADVLASPSWLEERLDDPGLCVIEIDVSPVAYGAGHIDGAVLWNVYGDLKDPQYRLIDKAAVQRLLEASGIRPESTVVFYGYAPAMGFWLMKLYGHRDVRILDCSRTVWLDEGRPWSVEAPVREVTRYPIPDADARLRADHRAVAAAIGDPASTILDVRTASEYRGERFWPSGGLEEGGRAGHVPGATNVSIEGLHDSHGAFRTRAELRRVFSPVDPSADNDVISYCTIGGRASTAWFVLTYLLGRQGVRVYDGSWAEWGLMPGAPIEQPSSPPSEAMDQRR